jgi:C-terminal processing protease CtpA/Prc
MKSKDALIHELDMAAQSMVQGSLSELTRQCGDPSCACFHDPAQRHGPHLYLKFSAEGKPHSVYVPPQQAPAIKSAHAAWLRFQEIGAQISAANRGQLLRDLQREKQKAKAMKGKARGKAHD